MVARHRIAGAGQISSINFGRAGRRTRLVTNSYDRAIRLLPLPAAYPVPPSLDDTVDGAVQDGDYVYLEQDLEPTHKFSDPISRTKWTGMTFNRTGDILAAGLLPVVILT